MPTERVRDRVPHDNDERGDDPVDDRIDERRIEERPWVIVNPKAGGGISQKKWARLVGAVSAGLGDIRVRFTEGPGHATALAHEIAMQGGQLIVAFGGDGTASEVAAGLLSASGAGAPPSQMGLIPRGTGGDFRRTLELPTDVAQAAEHIRNSRAHRIDVGHVRFISHEGALSSRIFINVASFGFSSDVAARANLSGKALGAKAAFLGATVRTLIAYENSEVMLELDGAAPIRRTLLLAALGNGRYFGGGMKICPDAKLDSGELSLVTVGDLGKMKVLASLPRLFAGTHLTIENVHGSQVRRLKASPVEPDQVIAIELDGETPGRLPATFEVLPRALLVRF